MPESDPHLTDAILATREKATAQGEALCRRLDCYLSGGWAHAGPCEPCGCGLNHAIAECPATTNTTKDTP